MESGKTSCRKWNSAMWEGEKEHVPGLGGNVGRRVQSERAGTFPFSAEKMLVVPVLSFICTLLE